MRDAGRIGALFFQMFDDVFDDFGVEIVAAQVVVAVAGQHLDHVVLDADHRHVESAAAQVVDQHFFVALMVGFVGQRGGGRFVDDPHHLQPGDFPGFAGGLALGVGEIGRHGDHRLVDRFAQMRLGDVLQPPQDDGGDFLGRVRGIAQFDPVGAAHPPLDGFDGAFRVEHVLVLGRFAHQDRAIVGQTDERGQDRLVRRDVDDGDAAVVHHRDFGVGGAQIDANDFFSHEKERLLLSSVGCRWRAAYRRRRRVPVGG